ncbi:DUF2192 domain-containing protein [Hyperthermus butylicus]|uniref:Conserved crenarchaeal protein n=1 Tax=Hyperthermus butylicus (strain DSM 5456 / JCM 9403 / PLM1-5) TaxID=415426 RepID=A2BL62_HYPBU|nr:DUF2192 domain-containing protein [Hyperthermus butylicus]ABM80723.1 conserved crenarchaeal protein [Hyperthermus butylicus DSM 5456]
MNSIEPRVARETQRQRINAAIEALSRLLRENIVDRKKAARVVEETYRAKAVQPIRGKAWPPDIWDKELATLYVIAKHAFALHEENPDFFHELFSYEETLEEAAKAILEKEQEEARKISSFLLGGDVSDNAVARLLRVVATAVVLGFEDEDKLIKLLNKLPRVFPEAERTVRKYSRFYIALRVAQAIAARIIRNRIDKEAFKQALAARIGIEKVIPDDEYIAFIAANVFEVPQQRLRKILSIDSGSKHVKRKGRISAAGS